jgi:hypothetical protein
MAGQFRARPGPGGNPATGDLGKGGAIRRPLDEARSGPRGTAHLDGSAHVAAHANRSRYRRTVGRPSEDDVVIAAETLGRAMPRAVFRHVPRIAAPTAGPYRHGSARGVEVSYTANPRDHSEGRSPF